ncbi:hypothetical protein CRG98_024760 [Punica granatum]|uniref:Phorbol-ester/DAG-type domain-containing protein n=1 Tax=Punica granatum TaxID=22663 RepID=A0A2I0JF60_PUNGR|nr:hypothetical protein CRG98_024760 [Punica granatum]
MFDAATLELFPAPYGEQYYVVDAGFPNIPGYLAPYKGQSYIYECYDCIFFLDVACAISTIHPTGLEDEKENMIQHFAHEHPLTSFDVKLPNRIDCRACQRQISGLVYGCRSCIFLLHQSCAELPREMQHPLHPQHPLNLLASPKKAFKSRGCDNSYQFAYSCDECALYLDVLCAVSTPPPSQEQEKDSMVMINHFSHQHPLRLLHIGEHNDALCCKFRRKKLLGGAYCCQDCVFFLHESCAKLPLEIRHFLHSDHGHLKLQEAAKYQSSKEEFRCGCCSCDCSGFAYRCERCSFTIDLECVVHTLFAFKEILNGNLPDTFSDLRRTLEGMISPSVHGHWMTISYSKIRETTSCIACGHPPEGLVYRCAAPCLTVLHKSCVEQKSELCHPHHPAHPLVLLPEAPVGRFICGASGRTRYGSTYYCTDCKFHMEIGCASGKPRLKHQRHEHMLTYFQWAKNLRCNSCGKSCNTDFYRCVPCNFNLHHGCLSLPATIKHQWHCHPLVLRDRLVDQHSTVHYCAKCEEIRNPDCGVYYCADCDNFDAHIECIIPPVEMKEASEDSEDYRAKAAKGIDEEIARKEPEIMVAKRHLKALQEEIDILVEERAWLSDDAGNYPRLFLKFPKLDTSLLPLFPSLPLSLSRRHRHCPSMPKRRAMTIIS